MRWIIYWIAKLLMGTLVLLTLLTERRVSHGNEKTNSLRQGWLKAGHLKDDKVKPALS